MNQINYKKSIKKQLLSMAMLMAMSLSASAQQLLPYQNPNLSVEARANDLLSRLTLEEKMKLMMDFPQPDGPMMATNSPSLTSSSTSRSAQVSISSVRNTFLIFDSCIISKVYE